jgi:hypothetical protein
MSEPEDDELSLALGYYDPTYLFISLQADLEEIATPPSELMGIWPDEKLLAYALNRYTFFHEMLHFHDYFGTMAGINLFYTHLRQVKAFAAFMEALRESGRRLVLPLDTAFSDSDPFADAAKAQIRNWLVLLQSTATFAQAFKKTFGYGHHLNDHVVYKKRGSSLPEVATFPVSASIRSPDDLQEVTIYYPIGLEALLEGNSQAVQRGLIESECSVELADKLVALLWPQQISPDQPLESLKDGILPYNITDVLVSKYLRLRGHPKFQRKSILQITDQTLSRSYLRALNEPWEVPPKFEFRDVGRLFVDTLEGSAIHDLVDGTVPWPETLTAMYKAILDTINKSKRPEDIPYAADFMAPLNIMESVVSHCIIAPLLKARIDLNHGIFHDVDKYVELLPTLPRPPVILRGSKHSMAGYMTSAKVSDAWIKYCLLTSAMHEIYGLKKELHCFRSHQLRKSSFNLCRPGTCQGNMAVGLCTEWFANQPLPDCVFASMVRRFELVH